ncbi:MAG: hypothetical protein LBK67_07545 [Coriobacteriales bacterium]|jgi:hypothetical protein|nr:hypothetical protein [Coriobacteriales bacterium]
MVEDKAVAEKGPATENGTMTEGKSVVKHEVATDDYWKKPEPQENKKQQDPGIGIWSRSRALRITVWIVVILIVVILALVVSAYLSGFDSVFEMINWMRESSNL